MKNVDIFNFDRREHFSKSVKTMVANELPCLARLAQMQSYR
jgi:hypothetical protein